MWSVFFVCLHVLLFVFSLSLSYDVYLCAFFLNLNFNWMLWNDVFFSNKSEVNQTITDKRRYLSSQNALGFIPRMIFGFFIDVLKMRMMEVGEVMICGMFVCSEGSFFRLFTTSFNFMLWRWLLINTVNSRVNTVAPKTKVSETSKCND